MNKNNRFLYNINGLINYIYPAIFLNKNKILSNLENRNDFKEITRRVNYYNKLGNIKNVDSKTCNIYDIRIPRNNPIKIRDFKIPKNFINYFFDTYEFIRYFDKNLKFILENGDVNYNLKIPAICKSRPIDDNNYNNVLLNLDKVRHFLFVKDSYKFEDKDDILYFRGGCYQKQRKKFLQLYFNDKRCDIGHTGKNEQNLGIYIKPKATIKEHLKHKFILSIEGNDVATNLKWIMSSNSIAVMPKPKFETWFMEGTLKKDFHYIEIDDNYENTFDKIDFFIKNPHLANKIIENANAYCRQFFNVSCERIISLLVLDKYFKNTKF